jgi:hypothetical protein
MINNATRLLCLFISLSAMSGCSQKRVHVLVRDAVTGMPIHGAVVTMLARSNSDLHRRNVNGTTDLNGQFEFRTDRGGTNSIKIMYVVQDGRRVRECYYDIPIDMSAPSEDNASIVNCYTGNQCSPIFIKIDIFAR